jgi:WD40 repeat protein
VIFDKNNAKRWRATLGKGAITSLAFSHDKKELLCGSTYPDAIHYDLASRKIYPPLITNGKSVVAVAFTEDDTRILTWTNNNEGQVWTRSGRLLDTIEEPSKTDIRSVEFSPNGDFIVLT